MTADGVALRIARFGDGEAALGAFRQELRVGLGSLAAFRVLEGRGEVVITGEAGAASAQEGWRALPWDGALSADDYLEVYATPAARPFSEAGPHVYLVGVSLDPAIDVTAFNQWYDGTHVPEVEPAGLTRGRRFRSARDPGHYIATYDMRRRDVLESEAIARVRGFGPFTPWVTAIERTVLERIGKPGEVETWSD